MSGQGAAAEVPAVLREAMETAPEALQAYFLQFEDLWERKLWKQLTDLLLAFYAERDSQPYRLKLYRPFIMTFAKHMDKLKLVGFGIAAAGEFQNPQLALDFMNQLIQDLNVPGDRDAYAFAIIESARVKLLLGEVESARTSTQEAGRILEELDSVDPIIHAAYYRISADYHKAKAEYTSYYRNALLYLACVNTQDLPVAEAQERAYDLSISALLGETIYNFGELLLHPILDSLDNTKHAWLRPFLSSLNAGDMTVFDSLLGNVSTQPLLQQSVSFLRQKICLMALIETIFRRPVHDRILSFETIAGETKLPTYEVEHLIMKALSLKLIRGSIDQVNSAVQISWVQPRVLNMKQVDWLQIRVSQWSTEVGQLESHMQAQSASFIEVS